jgi:hypothetical protein
MTNQGESAAKPNPLSPALQALARLVEEGKVEWRGGKPKGLRGVVVRGEPVSETIIRDRR